jgi:cell division protein FtsI/penicillin-binding protein 2
MIVIGGLSAVFAAFGYRLFDLHVVQHRELQAAASATRERVVHRPGRRGQILDARGNLLANSQSVRIVAADPSITTSQAVRYAQSLAPLLQMDANQLLVKLSGGGRYVRLKQKVDEETVQKIRDLKLKGLTFEDQFVRSYPNGTLASHVLGFVDSEHKGVQGVESSLDSYLRGRAGYEVIERDRRGREIRAFRGSEIGPQDGYNVVLTIDQVIQHIAEKELDQAMAEHRPQGGVIIVTRPKTGEILAMASRPTFDLNKPGDVAPDARRNRCISDVAEPGSTFKIVVAAAALNENLARLSDRFDCENGAWLHAGRVLHDAHPYGMLTLEEIVYHSSNIGAAKIAVERLGAARLYEYIRRFGFGKRTGIALPGEVSGIAHPLNRWTSLSITRIPMGHEIAATPLQMIMAMNAIANGGQLMRPMIVKRVMNADGSVFQEFEPQVTAQVINARTKIAMTAALRRVPTSEGTAPKAAVPGYEAAGKTGTAQKIENGRYVSRYYSSFCGYLPASDAEISILVSLDDPSGRSYYGGTVAGPVFRNVAEKVAQYLGIPPQVAPHEVKVASVL